MTDAAQGPLALLFMFGYPGAGSFNAAAVAAVERLQPKLAAQGVAVELCWRQTFDMPSRVAAIGEALAAQAARLQASPGTLVRSSSGRRHLSAGLSVDQESNAMQLSNLPGRTAVSLVLLGSAGAAFAQVPAGAGNYPNRSIRMIVPFPPGGATDILARITGQRLTDLWGQPVVIDNRPGAGGTIGAAIAAKANPDGYTLIMGTNASHAIAPSLYPKLPYSPLKDFAPVTLVANVPQALMVHPSVPARDVKELIAYAKGRPGALNYSSAGTGTPGHLGLELFQMMSGTKMVHVPFSGGAPGLAALVGGQVQVMADNMNSALPMIKAGKVRAIAVTTAKRSVALPDTATVAEQALPGFDSGSWFGLFAPAGTPAQIVARLNAEVVKMLEAPEVRERMLAQGAEPAPTTPAQFEQIIRSDIARWAKVIQVSGTRLD